jgi:hypothetical protein
LACRYPRILHQDRLGGRNYLALHLPITLKEAFAGSLVLYYDLTQMEKLILRLTIIISLTLLVFYLLFAYSLFPSTRKIDAFYTSPISTNSPVCRT